MILVVGATGLLGREICRRLVDHGDPVVALVRPGSPREADLPREGVTIRHGDLRHPETLAAVCTGINAVISTATCTTFRGKGDTLESVDRNGQLALVRAAREAGVERFVYVSLDPGFPESIPFVQFKREVERAVRASGMKWTILQPVAFMEVHLGPALGWDVEKGTGRILGDGNQQVSYISLHDVAAFAVRALDEAALENRDVPLTGPGLVSANEVAAIFEEATGRKFKIQRMPIGVLRVLRVLILPFNPVLASLMGLGLAETPPIDMAPVLAEFPMELISVRDYVKRVVDEARN